MLAEIIAAELADEIITKDEILGYIGHSMIMITSQIYCKAPTVPVIGSIIRFGETYYKVTDNTKIDDDHQRHGSVKVLDVEMIYPQQLVDVDSLEENNV